MSEIYNFHKKSPQVIGKQDVIGNNVQRQVQPMIIVDTMIYQIINLNQLLIITNFNSVVIIEQHIKLITELFIINKKWINVVLLIVEYLHMT